MRSNYLLPLVLSSSLALSAVGQPEPVGCEFPITTVYRSDGSTFAPGDGQQPDAAYGVDGSFVVAFLEDVAASDYGRFLFVRPFDAAGNYRSTPLLVAEDAEPVFGGPIVEQNRDGDFIVAWVRREATSLSGAGTGLFARRLSSQGTVMGQIFVIDSAATKVHSHLDIAAFEGGSFVVWEQDTANGSDIVGRTVSIDGEVLSPQFVLNGITAGDQGEPAVTLTAEGDIVAVWRGPDGSFDSVYGRRFDTSGVPQGPELVISTATGLHRDADVAAIDDGLLVVWSYRETSDEASDIYGRRLDATGTPIGSAFLMSPVADENLAPSVAARSAQDFVVAWREADDMDTGYPTDLRLRVASRTVDGDGALGPRFQVSSELGFYDCFGCSLRTDVAAGPADDTFLVVWGGATIPNQGLRIDNAMGQRYDALDAPTQNNVALTIAESEDPSDGIDLRYTPLVVNQAPCSTADFDLRATVPQAFLDYGFSVAPLNGATCSSLGAEVQCAGSMRSGSTGVVRIAASPLTEFKGELEIRSSVTLALPEIDLDDNSAVETTWVGECVETTVNGLSRRDCQILFEDGFESGDLRQWTATVP